MVDDNQDAARALALLLRLSGHDVRTAHDGPTAVLALAPTFAPDVMLLDIGMPGMDGYEVAGGSGKPRTSVVSLVALTGWGQEDDRQRSHDAGFDRHLVKPVDPDELDAVIRKLRPRP